MCCLFAVLALLGPRVVLFFYWLAYPVQWAAALGSSFIVGLLAFLFIPWTTLAYLVVFPGGVDGLDWVLVGLGLLLDLSTFGGGIFGNRDRAAGYYRR